MIVIPAVDIIGGKTVRLEKGDYDRKMSYDLTPVEAALEWQEQGAEYLHVIDLDGAREGRPVNLDIAGNIAREVNIPVEIGGGFRSAADIDKALSCGFDRVIVGSKVFEDMGFAEKIIREYGERIIISVDVDKGVVKTHGWKDKSGRSPDEFLKVFYSYGAERIIYTDISRDGTLSGPDTVSIKEMLDKYPFKMIYAGGIRDIQNILDLKALSDAGLEGVITGRALYQGTIDLREAIDACKTHNPLS